MRTSSKLLTQLEAAKVMGVDRRVLRGSARDGTGPPRLRLGKRFYYPRDGINRWLKGGGRLAVEAATPVAPQKPAPAAPPVRVSAPGLGSYGGGQRQVRTVAVGKATRPAISQRQHND